MRLGGGIVVMTAASLMLCSVASAAAPRWQTAVDKKYGISVSTPLTWCAVPPSVAQIEAAVVQLEKKYPALANVYSTFISSQTVEKKTLSYLFQAFQCTPYPTPYPDLTDFTISVARTTRVYTPRQLLASSSVFAQRFVSEGMTIKRASLVKLPAGSALLIEASWKETALINATVEEYVIPRGKILFSLSFSANVFETSAPAMFTEIARRFAFT